MKLKTILFLVVFASAAFAQNWVQIDSVFHPDGLKTSGFSAPHFADMNNDGALDVIMGNDLYTPMFYYNANGGNVPPKYVETPEMFGTIYTDTIPDGYSYYATADLDNDGDLDLTICQYSGFQYYENIGTAESPEWKYIDTLYSGAINDEVGSDAEPVFADIDNDGDYDLFVGVGSAWGGTGAGTIFSYRNIGTPEAPKFERDETLVNGIGQIGSYNCYPTFADLDNNGTLDLVSGGDYSTFRFYKNIGTPEEPVWKDSTTAFSFADNNHYWINPELVDLDGDGDYDFVYGTDEGNVMYYENVGTPESFTFIRRTNYFKIIQTPGGRSTVSFGDFNKDGLQDFISGNVYGDLIFFRNSGSLDAPAFKVQRVGFSDINIGTYGSNPIFVDIDNDDDLDIVAGGNNGNVFCYINDNGQFVENTEIFAGISASYGSFVTMADIDDDGDLDFLINGDDASDFKFYVNTGNNQFTEYPDLFADVSVPGRASVVFADPDADGDYDLVYGDAWGKVYVLENIGDSEDPRFQTNATMFANIEVDQNPYPGFADLNGDTKPDMVIGEYSGRLTYFENNFAVTGVEDEQGSVLPGNFEVSQNYPNPFNPETTIKFYLTEASNVTITVYDVLGNQISKDSFTGNSGNNVFKFNGSALSSGIYIYRVSAYDANGTVKNTVAKKMTLLK